MSKSNHIKSLYVDLVREQVPDATHVEAEEAVDKSNGYFHKAVLELKKKKEIEKLIAITKLPTISFQSDIVDNLVLELKKKKEIEKLIAITKLPTISFQSDLLVWKQSEELNEKEKSTMSLIFDSFEYGSVVQSYIEFITKIKTQYEMDINKDEPNMEDDTQNEEFDYNISI
jgi:hypothetical protein